MIDNILCEYVDRVMEKSVITEADLHVLQRDILADGATSREVVDVLVALDRAVLTRCEGWNDYLVAIVVDFAVWASRPTGVIDKDAAIWLVTTLSAGNGPTENAMRIAFEVVREAERCDETLMSFAMRRNGGIASASSRREHPAMLLS